jgi:hypothetical protein
MKRIVIRRRWLASEDVEQAVWCSEIYRCVVEFAVDESGERSSIEGGLGREMVGFRGNGDRKAQELQH